LTCSGKRNALLLYYALWYSCFYSGILIMVLGLTSHWTAATFMGILLIPRWEWMSEWMNETNEWVSERTTFFLIFGNVEPVVEWYWRGKPKTLERNLSQCHFVHYKSHWIDPGVNPGHRSERLATNRLSHGAASCVFIFSLFH
jgi:hypothetical protein